MIKKLLKYYKDIPVAARASIWFVFCSVLQKGIAFITTPIFTRLMSTEQYGQFTVYNSWVEVFLVFSTLDVFYGVYNNALTKYPESRDRVTSSMLGFCTTLTSVMIVVYMLFREYINELTKMSTPITVLLFLEILILPSYYFWSSKERFEYKYRKLIIVSISMAILSPLLGVPAVILSAEKGYARIITAVLSQVVIGVFLYISIMRKGKLFFDKSNWKYALAFNLPLLPHYLSSMVLNQSDRIMIDQMCGTDKAGIYGLAYTLGTMVIIFNNSIMNSFTPYTYKGIKNGDYSGIKKTANYLVIAIAVISVVVLMFAPEIVYVLGGDKYAEGVWIIAPVAASIFFRFLYGLYGNVEFYYEENYFIMIASVLCAAVNVATNYVFINMYGYLAAGYTTLGCYALYALAHYWFSQRVLKKHTDRKELYDNKFILMISIIVVLLSFVMMLIYNYSILRFSILAIVILIGIMYRKRILEIMNTIRRK